MTLHDLLNVASFLALCCAAGAVVHRLPVRCKKRPDCGAERRNEPLEAAGSEFTNGDAPGVRLQPKPQT